MFRNTVYQPSNIPVWPSSAGKIGEAREVVQFASS